MTPFCSPIARKVQCPLIAIQARAGLFRLCLVLDVSEHEHEQEHEHEHEHDGLLI
jgi:hypothetical protein